MSETTNPVSPSREFTVARLVSAGLIGGAIAATLNLLLYFGAKAAGVNMVAQYDPSAGTSTLPAAMVVVATIVPALVAIGLLAAMNRFLLKPSRAFTVLAGLGAVLSMGGPATLAGADGATKAVLAVMHLIAAGAIAGALLKLGRALKSS